LFYQKSAKGQNREQRGKGNNNNNNNNKTLKEIHGTPNIAFQGHKPKLGVI